MSSDTRWTTAVRLLALLSLVLAFAAIMEGRTVRRARAELQQLRTEREEAKVALTSTWARQSLDELRHAIGGLDDFYANTTEGFGRAGGLCAGGHLGAEPIMTFALGAYLRTRAAGGSSVAASDAMNAALRAAPEYRAIHPDLASRAPAPK